MSTLCKPSMSVPEHVITMEETLEFAEQAHAGKPQLPLALRLIQNTGVQKRHLVQPIEETLRHPGFEERNRIYEAESKKRCPEVIEQALANAGLHGARHRRDHLRVVHRVHDAVADRMADQHTWDSGPTPGRFPSHSWAARRAARRSTAPTTSAWPTPRATS